MAFSSAEQQARYRARLRLKRPLASPPPASEASSPADVADLMDALQAAYVQAAQIEAKRFLDKAYKNGDFDRIDPIIVANGLDILSNWIPKPPSKNMIKSIIEEAGARAGWQHQADILLVWFAKHRAANERRNDPRDK